MVCARSPVRDFESSLRIVVRLDEDDNQLILKQFDSISVIYESSPGIYIMKDISEIVYIIDDHEATLQIESDDVTIKTKLILTRFGSTVGTLKFNIKFLFFRTIPNFEPFWENKPTNAFSADISGVYTSDKILN